MFDPMHDAVLAAIDDAVDYNDKTFDPKEFDRCLAEYGFMIVPIEDPTNLFGVMEDSL